MKKILSSKRVAWLFPAMICCTLFLSNSIFAQYNTSYDGNARPINTGTYNCVFGLFAFYSNATGGYNTATGASALGFNSDGSDNTANGYAALYHNTSGNRNTAVGSQALFNNTIGSENVANGVDALRNNTSGIDNTANGIRALYWNATGSFNTANGFEALSGNTSGSRNTATGVGALYAGVTGQFNTATGGYALAFEEYGNSNTAEGYSSLHNNFAGNHNVAFGDSAGFYSSGSSNVFLGSKAGFRETGSNKMYIGNDSTATLIYGDFSSGQVLLGKPNPTGYVFKGTRKLNVLGGILSDSMRLAPGPNWADHVFNKDYKLKSLKELEQYVSINEHLPGIPTASEVKANGVNVAEIETKLLEKVEELTLYVIELKKENERQQMEINRLQRRR